MGKMCLFAEHFLFPGGAEWVEIPFWGKKCLFQEEKIFFRLDSADDITGDLDGITGAPYWVKNRPGPFGRYRRSSGVTREYWSPSPKYTNYFLALLTNLVELQQAQSRLNGRFQPFIGQSRWWRSHSTSWNARLCWASAVPSRAWGVRSSPSDIHHGVSLSRMRENLVLMQVLLAKRSLLG